MSAWAFDVKDGWSQISDPCPADQADWDDYIRTAGFEQVRNTTLDESCPISLYQHKSVGQRRFTTGKSVQYQYLVSDTINNEDIYVTNYPSIVELLPKFGMTIFVI